MKTDIVGSVETLVTISQFTHVTPQKNIIKISFIITIILCYTTFYTLKKEASFAAETLASLYRNIWIHAPREYVYSSL